MPLVSRSALTVTVCAVSQVVVEKVSDDGLTVIACVDGTVIRPNVVKSTTSSPVGADLRLTRKVIFPWCWKARVETLKSRVLVSAKVAVVQSLRPCRAAGTRPSPR